ncbi:MAG: lysophospholipase [Bacteroidia bacterium]
MPTNFKLSNANLELHGTHYLNPLAKAQIIVIHGFGEHQGRYIHVAQEFLNDGLTVYTMDLSGHGLSDGKRGDIFSMEQYLDELEELINYVLNENKDLPLYLMGHSMGGLVSATYALKRDQTQIEGLILSSPWFRLALKPNPIQLVLAKILVKLRINFTQNANLNVDHLSSDLRVGKAYREDELVHGKLTPRAFFEIFNHGIWCQENASKLKIGCLVSHGSDDRIISIDGSKSFANKAGADFEIFEGAMHEPHNEHDRGKFIKVYGEWINRKLA